MEILVVILTISCIPDLVTIGKMPAPVTISDPRVTLIIEESSLKQRIVIVADLFAPVLCPIL